MSLMDVLRSCPEQRALLLEALDQQDASIHAIGATPHGPPVISFDPRDLPSPSKREKLLHYPFVITIDTPDCIIKRTIVDNGSSVNAMPARMLKELGIVALESVPWKCQGYDGTEKSPLGAVSLSLTLGGKTVSVEVAVLDADVEYNLLLGRPWLDQMGAVCSTQWGQLKFVHEGQVKVVAREPMPSHTSRPACQAVFDDEDSDPEEVTTSVGPLFQETDLHQSSPMPCHEPNLVRFAPIGVGSYGYLAVMDDSDSDSEGYVPSPRHVTLVSRAVRGISRSDIPTLPHSTVAPEPLVLNQSFMLPSRPPRAVSRRRPRRRATRRGASSSRSRSLPRTRATLTHTQPCHTIRHVPGPLHSSGSDDSKFTGRPSHTRPTLCHLSPTLRVTTPTSTGSRHTSSSLHAPKRA